MKDKRVLEQGTCSACGRGAVRSPAGHWWSHLDMSRKGHVACDGRLSGMAAFSPALVLPLNLYLESEKAA